MRLKRTTRNVALGLAGLALGACSTAQTENVPQVEGPKPQLGAQQQTPAQETAKCLAAHLQDRKPGQGKPAPANVQFAVGSIKDATGRGNRAGNKAVGSFLSQGTTSMMYTALRKTGANVVSMANPQFRRLVNYYVQKGDSWRIFGDGQSYNWGMKDKNGNPVRSDFIQPQTGTVTPPTHLIQGAWTSLDFIPGGGVEARVGGVGAKYRTHRIQVRGDFRVTRMPKGRTRGGTVVATRQIYKQLFAEEVRAGLHRYFGSGSGTTFVQFEAGRKKREAVQFTQGVMTQYMANELVRDVYNVEPGVCPSYLEKAVEQHNQELQEGATSEETDEAA